MSATEQTILLNIYERLGSIEATLEAGAETHKELKAGLAQVDRKVDCVEHKMDNLENSVAAVERTSSLMKPIVDDYQKNKQKAAGILLAIVTIAGFFGYFASEIKAALFGRPHP